MGEGQATNEILELIRLIDRNKARLFHKYDLFCGYLKYPFIMTFGLFALVWGYEFVLSILLAFQERIDIAVAASGITILLSLFAAITAVLSLFSSFFEENIVEVNYDRLKNCVKDENKPLLKALIKMKTRNREFNLEQVYNMNINHSLFKKEKLLEKLYEHRS